jgi:hypothetical protein
MPLIARQTLNDLSLTVYIVLLFARACHAQVCLCSDAFPEYEACRILHDGYRVQFLGVHEQGNVSDLALGACVVQYLQKALQT